MNDMTLNLNPTTNAEYQVAIDQMLTEIKRKREMMRPDDIEIAASQARADINLQNIQKLMEELKAARC